METADRIQREGEHASLARARQDVAASTPESHTLDLAPNSALTSRALLELQRRAGNAGVADMLAEQQSERPQPIRGGGEPLDPGLRTGMEASFGADFGSVRVHRGSEAARSAAAFRARAYTVGEDVVLGEASPDARTIAHELSHVVQQRAGPVEGTDVGAGVRVSDPSDRFERAAEATADRVISGAPARDVATGARGVQRQGPEEEEEKVQTLALQRQEPEEEEENVQTLALQRQEPEEEEEKGVQTLALQRQEPEEEEESTEAVQGLPLQRQEPEPEEEEEKGLQTLALQRQEEGEEEEEKVQTLALQRQEEGEEESAEVVQELALQRQPPEPGRPPPVVARRPPRATSATFEPDVVEVATHTVPVSAEGSGIREIGQLVEEQKSNLELTRQALKGALDNLSEFQTFASSKEAQPDYGGAVLKFATKQIVDAALGSDAVKNALPGIGKAYKITFGLVEELEKEGKRAAKAAAEVGARDFLVEYRAQIDDLFNERIKQSRTIREELSAEYQRLAGTEATTRSRGRRRKPVAGWVVGPQAELLTGLRKAVAAYRVPKSDECLRAFTEAWVIKSEGVRKSRGGGDIYTDGRILLTANIYKRGGDYKVTSWPTSGKLLAPRASKIVDAFGRVFEKGAARTTNDLRVLKELTIVVEDEVWGFNDTYSLIVDFRNPARPSFRSVIPSPVTDETVRKAPDIGKRAYELVFATPGNLGVTVLSPGSEGRVVGRSPPERAPAPAVPAPVPAPGPNVGTPAPQVTRDAQARRDAKAAVNASLGAEFPEIASVLVRLIDDRAHHLNLVEALLDATRRPRTIAILHTIATGATLGDRKLEDFVREHPGTGPLFEKLPAEVNFDQKGRSRKKTFLAWAKGTDAARRVGARPDEEERKLVEEYAKRLREDVEPLVYREVEALTRAVNGESGGGATFNVRTKDAAAIIDKVRRMAKGREGQKPKPDAQVGDMVDAVGARITVKGVDQLGRLLQRVRAHYGTGDRGRIIELENLYLNPKAKNFAYRVIPITVVVEVKGMKYTYELQLTTEMASVAADLEHNAIYKDYIHATPAEKRRIRAAMREAAAIEQLETRKR